MNNLKAITELVLEAKSNGRRIKEKDYEYAENLIFVETGRGMQFPKRILGRRMYHILHSIAYHKIKE